MSSLKTPARTTSASGLHVVKITAPPGVVPIWQEAMEKQLSAFSILDKLMSMQDIKARRLIRDHGFSYDYELLKHAIPYAWTKETIQATLAASHSIPDDTVVSGWNLDSPAVWWYFEEPLPIRTVEVFGLDTQGVRALSFGWIQSGGAKIIACSAWCDHGEDGYQGMTISPSQTWIWNEGFTLNTILLQAAMGYEESYGPGKKYEKSPHIGKEPFLLAVDYLSKFILAGMAWINQKIVSVDDGHIERHRRKDFNRTLKRELDSAKIISLRKMERSPSTEGETEVTRQYVNCRWEVDGHWRNQAVGPNHSEKRLRWIGPYVKGLPEAPFRIPKFKVYRVDR